ncbi:MAG: GNAT family N-acetyltransferase [Gammaproteobacteria bacterium]|nr:GNAT family N-acetyltransferase [Gammaproteobacteria bacterium]
MVTEDNGLLAAKGHENAVYSETIGYLFKEYKQYDEFFFGAIPEDINQLICDNSIVENAACIINERSVSRHIDLTIFPPGIIGYLASLSKNRRGQIRRSIRLYEKDGSLQIDEADNVSQALLYLDQLKALHSDYWQLKGESGSFANPLWEKFQRELISRRFDAGEIQLLKVSSKCGEIGYLYNIVLNKHVYVIQTGFQRNQDKRLMPGYVAHTLAIAYNSSKGMAVYDLLFGDSLYKQILCNRSRKFLWVVIQRKRLKFIAEKFAVSLVRRYRELSSDKPGNRS